MQDFLAPEYALSETCSPASDMFSLGMVAFTLYNLKPLFTSSGNWGMYKRNSSEVSFFHYLEEFALCSNVIAFMQLKSLREANLQLIPTDLKDYLKMLLGSTPDLRPDAAQFSKIGFFDDIGVKTLNNLVRTKCLDP